jgi:hypothetical protein
VKVKAHPHYNKIRWGHVRNISVKGPDWLDYYSFIVLHNVTFKVSEAGRRRALREQKRNVHAWAIGDLLAANIGPVDAERMARHFESIGYHAVYYNPYQGPMFNVKGGGTISDAKSVVMFGTQCWARGINEE